MTKQYKHVLGTVVGRPWALMPEKLEEIRAVLAMRLRGEQTSWDGVPNQEFMPRFYALEEGALMLREISAAEAEASNGGGTVAVLPLYGVMMQRVSPMAEMSGATSTEKFKAAFRQQVNNPGVKSIILDVDSPGGSVFGTDELATEIRNAAARKPVIAVADSLMASAAYYVSAGASEVVASPSSEIGSIGVLAVHYDWSENLSMEGIKPTLIKSGKYKAEGHADFPLSYDALQHIQEDVNRYYEMFLQAVAKGRDVGVERVRNGFGEGRVVGAREAVRLGMADRVATLEETIARFAGGGRPSKKAALDEGPELQQEAQAEPEAGPDERTRTRARALQLTRR